MEITVGELLAWFQCVWPLLSDLVALAQLSKGWITKRPSGTYDVEIDEVSEEVVELTPNGGVRSTTRRQHTTKYRSSSR
jgi:hypothetical protein